MIVAQIERQVIADRQIIATYNAGGNFEQQPMPSLDDILAEFEASLLAPPQVVDSSQAELLQMMRGVA